MTDRVLITDNEGVQVFRDLKRRGVRQSVATQIPRSPVAHDGIATAVILNSDLDAPTSPLVPTWAWATICRWSEDDGRYFQSGDRLYVANHSVASDHAADTFGFVFEIDGHPRFFGDCDPWASRPDPPAAI